MLPALHLFFILDSFLYIFISFLILLHRNSLVYVIVLKKLLIFGVLFEHFKILLEFGLISHHIHPISIHMLGVIFDIILNCMIFQGFYDLNMVLDGDVICDVRLYLKSPIIFTLNKRIFLIIVRIFIDKVVNWCDSFYDIG